MAIDARSLVTDQIETDICIVGSGPAGISLAREFIGQTAKVALLESGGAEFDPQTQALAEGKTFGDSLAAPEIVNNRQLGGNSNIWVIQIGDDQIGVRHTPFDEIDFEKRDWIPYSGWPFKRDQLMPYYEKAQGVCDLGAFAYKPDDWETDKHRKLPLDGYDLETGMFQFGRRKVFYDDYLKELEAAANTTIYSYANAVELTTNAAGKAANRLRVACLNGKQFWVTAKVFVLACGGFENARLLLLSNNQQATGLGNQNDVVGRYYHDHPRAISGYFVPHNRKLINQSGLYDLRRTNGFSVQGFLRLPREILEREKLIGVDTMLFPRPNERETRALTSFKYVGENTSRLFKNIANRSGNGRKAVIPNNLLTQLPKESLKMMTGCDSVAKALYLKKAQHQHVLPNVGSGGWSELRDISKRFERFEMMHLIEQSPHPENRVRLSADRDALGYPKLEVHWRWYKDDAENFTRSVKFMSEELTRAGLGTFKVELNEDRVVEIRKPAGSHHLMGTTRMHDNPKYGVVDAECRVHGINNLFIAGSSTFPTGGYANPTLTIVAMSLRMADCIKKTLI